MHPFMGLATSINSSDDIVMIRIGGNLMEFSARRSRERLSDFSHFIDDYLFMGVRSSKEPIFAMLCLLQCCSKVTNLKIGGREICVTYVKNCEYDSKN